MTASIIDGKIISAEVRAEAKLEVERFIEQYKTKPCLAVVLVGENPASQVYVRTKSKMAKEIGMDVEDHIKQKDCYRICACLWLYLFLALPYARWLRRWSILDCCTYVYS